MPQAITQKITVIPKPSVVIKRSIGCVIQAFEEYGLTLTNILTLRLSKTEIVDTYNVIGLAFEEGEEEDWCIAKDGLSEKVFTLTFSGPDAHEVVSKIKPHLMFPVIYVKLKA